MRLVLKSPSPHAALLLLFLLFVLASLEAVSWPLRGPHGALEASVSSLGRKQPPSVRAPLGGLLSPIKFCFSKAGRGLLAGVALTDRREKPERSTWCLHSTQKDLNELREALLLLNKETEETPHHPSQSNNQSRGLSIVTNRDGLKETRGARGDTEEKLPHYSMCLQQQHDRCSGCGAPYQGTDPYAAGYLAPHLLLMQQQRGPFAGLQGPAGARPMQQRHPKKKQTETETAKTAANAAVAAPAKDYEVSAEVSQLAAAIAAETPGGDAVGVEKALIEIALRNPQQEEEETEGTDSTSLYHHQYQEQQHEQQQQQQQQKQQQQHQRRLLCVEGLELQRSDAKGPPPEEGGLPLGAPVPIVPQQTEEEKTPQLICQRCHCLRFGWNRQTDYTQLGNLKETEYHKEKETNNEKETDKKKETDKETDKKKETDLMVLSLRKKRCIFLLVIDCLSLEIPEALLRCIDSPNPLFVAINKADLLPSKPPHLKGRGPRSQAQTEVLNQLNAVTRSNSSSSNNNNSSSSSRGWRRDISPADGRVHFISSKTGEGVASLFREVLGEAKRRHRPVYLLGAANSGKSSLCSYLYKRWGLETETHRPKAGVSVSALPGTTRGLSSFLVDGSCRLYDTPGLISKGALSPLLTPTELKAFLGPGELHCNSLRLEGGEGVFIGGVAFIYNEGRGGIFLTPMINRNVSVISSRKHSPQYHEEKDRERDAQENQQQQREHLQHQLKTRLLRFPSCVAAAAERRAAVKPLVSHNFEIEGKGWRQGSIDIVLGDIGWCSLTGSGRLKVSVFLPSSVSCRLRETVLPQPLLLCPALSREAWRLRALTSSKKHSEKETTKGQENMRGDRDRIC